VGRTPAARSSALPVELGANLDDAFASEVALRLPRLLGATTRLTDGSDDAAQEILSDTHALASSAAVVGEDLAAYAARECEQMLTAFVHPGQGASRPDAAARIAGAVDALRWALSRWTDTVAPRNHFPRPVVGRR
jgi:HPt (histidine-containing phosphotransfer) domain-containing protein